MFYIAEGFAIPPGHAEIEFLHVLILSERLGYSAEQIAGLTDAGVLGNKDS